MADVVLVEDWTPGRRLRLKTSGRYSMDVAIEILRWIEGFEDVSIPDPGGNTPGSGDLVEVGVPVQLGSIRFSIMCSHDDLSIDRLAGSNRKFTTLCEAVRQRFATG